MFSSGPCHRLELVCTPVGKLRVLDLVPDDAQHALAQLADAPGDRRACLALGLSAERIERWRDLPDPPPAAARDPEPGWQSSA